ncbi:MAG: hypothetical protein ACOC87_04365, partial [Candidatus Natronoplasma sp.]
MRDRIVSELAENNTVLTPDAMEYLENLEDASKVIDKLTESKENLPFPVCKETISDIVEDHLEVESKAEAAKRREENSIELTECLEVMKDVSGNST